MRWLLDNNVPRSVTHLLRDRGRDVVEVREVLAPDAPDADVLAYARATERVLVTHDVALVRRARASAHPHLWLRTREVDDRERLAADLDTIEEALAEGADAIRLLRSGLWIG